MLKHEDLLEYQGLHGTRALCHLLVYECAGKPPVCLVGNFDGGLGTSTTNAIEIVATAVADRIGRDAFRLVEWYPHGYRLPFSEVALTRAQPRKLAHGQVGTCENAQTRDDSAVTRFADPQWDGRSEYALARLLGEEAARELRSLAGLPGEYTAERLFGSTGRRQAEAVRDHNRQVFDALAAQVAE